MIAAGSVAPSFLLITFNQALDVISSSICVTNHANTPMAGPFGLQERLNVDLQGADRVLELVLAQHGGVEDTEGANEVVLAGNAQVNGGTVAGEVGWIWRCCVSVQSSCGGHERGMRRTIQFLDVVMRITNGGVVQALLGDDECALQHRHHAVEQTVNNLEATALAVEGSSKVTLVATLALQGHVLESNVADLEDLHRHAVGLVLTDRLQQTGEKTGANHLELGGLGVGKLDSGVAIVLAVQPGKVLVMRAKNEWQNLRPTSHSSLNTNDVGELVDGEGLGNGAGLAGERARKVVEAVGDGNILHDITLVENIGASRGNLNINGISVVRRRLGTVCHLGQEVADLKRGKIQATALVDVGHLGCCGTGSKVRGDPSLTVVL